MVKTYALELEVCEQCERSGFGRTLVVMGGKNEVVLWQRKELTMDVFVQQLRVPFLKISPSAAAGRKNWYDSV
jgi:hypothetical protein